MTLMIDPDPALLDNSVWFSRLESMALTEVSGVDNKRFLQGQLSCNLLKLGNTNSLRGALCNLKGRVIADVRLLQLGDAVLMLSRYDLQEKIFGTLNKYRVFFKTALADVNAKYSVFGIGGVDIEAIVSELGINLPLSPDACCYHQDVIFIRMPATTIFNVPRFLVVCARDSDQGIVLSQRLQNALVEVPEILWSLADIRTGQAHPDLNQSELFTPQLLNYDINGVIDFKKGCYTGQEIVARMFYKADAKRRLFYSNSTQRVGDTGISDADALTDDVVATVKFSDGSHESLVIFNCEQALLMESVRELA